jgi:drug/metabolite transporter (DMT)-like permease
LFSLAALYIPSGLSAVLNSTSPMFSFLFSIFLFSERISVQKIIGLVLGTVGVFVISMDALEITSDGVLLGILACITASFLYALTVAIIKSRKNQIDSRSLAIGNQVFGGLFLLPLIFVYPINGQVTWEVILLLVIFGALGSGLASMLYYKLMVDVGPLYTLTVTYLLPIFGIIWGFIVLGERLSYEFLLGGVLILLGTILVTREFKRQTT